MILSQRERVDQKCCLTVKFCCTILCATEFYCQNNIDSISWYWVGIFISQSHMSKILLHYLVSDRLSTCPDVSTLPAVASTIWRTIAGQNVISMKCHLWNPQWQLLLFFKYYRHHCNALPLPLPLILLDCVNHLLPFLRGDAFVVHSASPFQRGEETNSNSC